MNTDEKPSLLTLLPVDMAGLGRLIEEAAERGASKALARHDAAELVNSEQAAQLLGYRRADGSANLPAFKSFRGRRPDFVALGLRLGHRWHWRRADLERWLAEHPRAARSQAEGGTHGP